MILKNIKLTQPFGIHYTDILQSNWGVLCGWLCLWGVCVCVGGCRCRVCVFVGGCGCGVWVYLGAFVGVKVCACVDVLEHLILVT